MNPLAFFAPPPQSARTSAGLLIIRLVAGLAFMFHGWGKIQSPMNWMGPDATTPGILQALAAVSEFVGGLAWILGALMPLFSVGLACTMAFAINFHASKGDPFVGQGGSYEPATVYLAIALLFLLTGPGQYSLDWLLQQTFGRRGQRDRLS